MCKITTFSHLDTPSRYLRIQTNPLLFVISQSLILYHFKFTIFSVRRPCRRRAAPIPRTCPLFFNVIYLLRYLSGGIYLNKNVQNILKKGQILYKAKMIVFLKIYQLTLYGAFWNK